MRKMDYGDYLKTGWWKRRRIMKLKESKNRCEKCGSRKHLKVHHKTYFRLGGEKRKDLEVLCSECHSNEHSDIIQAKKNIKIMNQEFQSIIGDI